MGEWIKEPQRDLLANEEKIFRGTPENHYCSQTTNVNSLWKENNVYIMDNHLAAGWCWLQECLEGDKYKFLHIDQHSDDISRIENDEIADLLKTALKDITFTEYINQSIYKNGIRVQLFQCESYIRPMAKLFPQWFTKCVFAVHNRSNLDKYQEAVRSLSLKDELNSPCIIKPDKINTVLTIVSRYDCKWILNIDIDYFYLENRQVLEDNFFEQLRTPFLKARKNFHVITIALSPTWCRNLSDSFAKLKLLSNLIPEINHFDLSSYL